MNQRSGQPAMREEQWYDDKTLYQILLVEPSGRGKEQILKERVIIKTRKDFETYLLDEETKEKLKDYPKADGTGDSISSYLPSPGVLLPPQLRKKIFDSETDKDIININNFYDPLRTLLHCRKTSQLIAKTWHAKDRATKKEKNDKKYWDLFLEGEWDQFSKWNEGKEKDILDSLIVREIFLSTTRSQPDKPKKFDDNFKLGMKDLLSSMDKTRGSARFIILPNSRGWQGITLSLLLAGQAYREVDGKYHQITQPILSTGEIVGKYHLRVSCEKSQGEIREIPLDYNSPCTTFEVTLPYPPIPHSKNVKMKYIKKWAYADEEGGNLPFYIKEKDEFVIGTKYVAPPYPYIPVSTTC